MQRRGGFHSVRMKTYPKIARDVLEGLTTVIQPEVEISVVQVNLVLEALGAEQRIARLVDDAGDTVGLSCYTPSTREPTVYVVVPAVETDEQIADPLT